MSNGAPSRRSLSGSLFRARIRNPFPYGARVVLTGWFSVYL